MKKVHAFVIVILLFSQWSNAELINNHDGTVTQVRSDGSRIMWMIDANYAKTSGFDPDGQIPWDIAMSWASSVTFAGHTGWRLPVANENWAGSGGYSDNSEMGDLYYNELGNTAGNFVNAGPFYNIMSYWYYTKTLFVDPNHVMVFSFRDIANSPTNEAGWQSDGDRYAINGTFVWLVRDVPETAPPNTYFAHVADGGDRLTTFTISNPTENAAAATLILKDGDGSPWFLSLNGTYDSQFSLSIPAMGSLRLMSSGSSSETETGWAVLNSESTLHCFASQDFYKKSSSNRRIPKKPQLQDSVITVGTNSGERFALPMDVSPSSEVGFAITNAGFSPATVWIAMKDEEGNTVDEIILPQLNPLGVESNIWLMAGEIFPNLKDDSFKGLMVLEVIGDGDIAISGIAYIGDSLSAIPVIDLSDTD